MSDGCDHASSASGRFLLRLRPQVHAALRRAALGQGLSLNEYCARVLALPPGVASVDAGPAAVVGQAAGLFGEALDGVVVFGSWARGEAATTSDIDVLVVVAPSVAINRGLYRRWDEAPVRWSDRSVEGHFVHLPRTPDHLTGLWAEVARDGIMLYERDFRVSRFLAQVRARLLAGKAVRRTVFGQPYWMETTVDAQS